MINKELYEKVRKLSVQMIKVKNTTVEKTISNNNPTVETQPVARKRRGRGIQQNDREQLQNIKNQI